jgi:two-component system, NtrC family, sensor kinase
MKKFFALLLVTCFFANELKAQPHCFGCDRDSLQKLEQKATDPAEKLKLLDWMLEIHYDMPSLEELIEIGSKVKGFNVAPYKLLRQAYDLFLTKDWNRSLGITYEAIDLFDKQKKVNNGILTWLRLVYNSSNRQEERLRYFRKKLTYYQQHGPAENIPVCLYGLAGYYSIKNDFNLAISYYLKSADFYKAYGREESYRNHMGVVGNCYARWGNDEKASYYLNLALSESLKAKDTGSTSNTYGALANLAIKKKKFDEAEKYAFDHLRTARQPIIMAQANVNLARVQLEKGNPAKALPFLAAARSFRDSIQVTFLTTSGDVEVDYYFYVYHQKLHQLQKAESYLLAAYKNAHAAHSTSSELKYLQELSLFYSGNNNAAEAYKFGTAYFALRDSVENQVGPFRVAQYENEQKEAAQNEKINVLKQEQAIQQFKLDQRNQFLWIGLAVFALIAALSVFLFVQLRANKKTLHSLRKTQRQLVQSEKMASLGELTAGIAHEIQNPLNFINNFSEVNIELLEEAETELANGKVSDAKEILASLKQNLQKITHHGSRADGIVKSMLEHSRTSKGDKQTVDINAFIDEYLRLSYHGLRAKDKSFNAILETHFDPAAGKISINPQEMGRVLLNLFSNAFYSVNKKKQHASTGYDPTVAVTTSRAGNKVEVSVKDNGTGIPEQILNKIYQPFFTTKPTGEGTGLGLSLSYDIITKGHGGEMKVETKEGEGAEFIIELPNQ